MVKIVLCFRFREELLLLNSLNNIDQRQDCDVGDRASDHQP